MLGSSRPSNPERRPFFLLPVPQQRCAALTPLPTIAPGQESVWPYPRPPRLESVPVRLRVVFDGVLIADTTAGHRVLETSHPPVYYLPPGDVSPGALVRAPGTSVCEWKGAAIYFIVVGPSRRAPRAAWAYP
jgi:uncharacterized protein (DUF427 family)